MEPKSDLPSFTVSLRGYDRVEVDEYLKSMNDALGEVDEAQEENRHLQAQIARLNGRIKELEDHINADTPKTGAILGERIGILLRMAEETATDTVLRAEAESARIEEEAKQRLAEADEAARGSIARGQEQARRIEAAARAQASEIGSEAEQRASARTRQIEQWAEQVISHTRAEEARMLREQEEKRRAAIAELRSLAEQRDAVAATLAQLRETLGQALGLVAAPERTALATSAAASAAAASADAAGPTAGQASGAGTLLSDPAGASAAAAGVEAPGVEAAGVEARHESLSVPLGGDGSSAAGITDAADQDATGQLDLTAGAASVVDDDAPAASPFGGVGAVPASSHPTGTSAGAVAEHEEEGDDRAGSPSGAERAEAVATGTDRAADRSDDSEADEVDDEDHPWWEPRDVRPPFDGEALEADDDSDEDDDAPGSDQIELRSSESRSSSEEEEEFEAKLEAWVSDGAKHFRRW